jgi:hypothetical protein
MSRIHTSMAFVAWVLLVCDAFTVGPHHPKITAQRFIGHATRVFGSASDEILARARKAAGVPDSVDDEYPKNFEDKLLADMQSALLKLERRVQEGPGALSLLEVEELDGELSRVIAEMRANGDQRPIKPKSADPSGDLKSAAPSATATATSVGSSNSLLDEEGEAYDGKGGMGQPKGTINTYIIEGMEEMSSEEYRLALERSLIDRQAARRQAGVVGNKSTWDYMSQLNPNDKGILRRDDEDDDDDEEDERPKKKKKRNFKPF